MNILGVKRRAFIASYPGGIKNKNKNLWIIEINFINCTNV